MKSFLCIGLLFLSFSTAFSADKTININISAKLFSDSAVYTALEDIKTLLEAAFHDHKVTFNKSGGEIDIFLQISDDKNIPTAKKFPSSFFTPVHFYKWMSKPSKEGFTLLLTSPDRMGIVFGLYGLLQQKLGFRFYHPKNTLIPSHGRWPLAPSFTFTGTPRFDKRGFHLHTMHPMELTEQIHSKMEGTALADVKEYIDWLVRSGQNTFQFWLLRTVNKNTWPEYAEKYVSYAQKRGLYAGVVVSLSTLQQKAFQMVNLLKPLSPYKKQIDENLKWLMQVPFDFVSIDFTMGEYLPDLSKSAPVLKEYLINRLKFDYGVYVMENTHVIKREKSKSPECAGLIIHSVMFYSLTEEHAPVYGNKNQRFMYEMMQESKQTRETWYWPESSYWVTFDTSVPLFLLPYLKSRLDDIIAIENDGIDGHITFTSGWEWGYWLIDYSIAGWTWKYNTDGKEEAVYPLEALVELFGKENRKVFEHALALQKSYMKDNRLISMLSAKTPFEELPWPFNKTFQPTGGASMLKAAIPFIGRKHREKIKEDAELLLNFYEALTKEAEQLEKTAASSSTLVNMLREEITDSLRITALRAKHRYYTLIAGAYRNYHLKDSSKFYLKNMLRGAEKTREEAAEIVRKMEKRYRYPVSLIARRLKGHTSYDFGYLYPVSDLYFWKREENQAQQTRFDAFYMNLWDFWSTLGLDGLF